MRFEAKRFFNITLYFALFFGPIIAISFFARTPLHQSIFLISLIVSGAAAFYVSGIIHDRDRLGREVFLQNYELKKAKEALNASLVVDSETHIYNERLLGSRLCEECDRARRYRRPLSFLLVSIDSGHELIEHHGQIISEVLIQELCQFLRESMRGVDIIIRDGDERVVILLPETAITSASVAAERIRYAIEKKVFRIEGKEIKLTVCVGLLAFDASIHKRKEDVLTSLENALNKAKKIGPNKVATVTNEMG